MKIGSKIAIGFTILSGLGLYVWSRIAGAKNFINNLVLTPKWYGSINDMQIDVNKGIKLPLAVDVENRSDEEMTVQINSVTATSKDGSDFATSKAGNYKKTIKKQSTTTFPIDIWISATTVYTILGTALVDLITGSSNVKSKAKSLVENATMRINLSAKGVTVDVNVTFGQSKKVGSVGALGLVNTSDREILPLSDYQHLLPPYSELEYADNILINDVTPEETAQFVRQMAREYRQDTERLSDILAKPTVKETVKSIWDFCVKHIKYEQDSSDNEQVRRPLRTLYEQRADCDCYSALIASICENLGLNYKLRISEYDHKGYYQHIYVIIEGYVCDPVVDQCFYEKPTTKHKDF